MARPLTKPRVSVLLPVFDAETTLEAALECAIAQTYEDLEIVVVLNGITDRSAQIAHEAATRDPRIRVFERPQANLADALTEGLERCRGVLVVRHDADDHMDPRRVALQVSSLDAHPEWIGVTARVRSVGLHAEPGEGMNRHVAWLNSLDSPEAIRAGRFIDAPLAHPAVTFRRREVLEAGGYRDGDFPEDHELWLRLFEAGALFGHVDERLVDWTDRPERFTRTNERCRAEARRNLVHSYLASGPLADGRRARIWGAGPFGKKHARDLHRRFACVDDLIDIDPKKVGRQVAGGLPVVSNESIGAPDGRLILLAVGSPGARGQIEAFLQERGHEPERDYLALH
jgi:glycosyltransferase involved in cell wall biosynthesis